MRWSAWVGCWSEAALLVARLPEIRAACTRLGGTGLGAIPTGRPELSAEEVVDGWAWIDKRNFPIFLKHRILFLAQKNS
jgi:hypothetical protein